MPIRLLTEVGTFLTDGKRLVRVEDNCRDPKGRPQVLLEDAKTGELWWTPDLDGWRIVVPEP